jgi:hypothetical protein
MLRKRPIVIVLIIIFIVAGALGLNRLVQDSIAPVVLSALWQIWLVVSGFPQVVAWAIFIAIIPIIAIFSLFRGWPALREDAKHQETQYPGRVQVLTHLIQQAPEGDYFKMQLERHLVKLALDTLEYRERLPSSEIRKRLESGDLQIDPAIRQYLQAGWRRRIHEARALAPLKKRKSKSALRLGSQVSNAWYDPKTEGVIQFLETELEVNGES